MHQESMECVHALDKGLYISIQYDSQVIRRFAQRSQFLFFSFLVLRLHLIRYSLFFYVIFRLWLLTLFQNYYKSN